jgi:hypothetical protein
MAVPAISCPGVQELSSQAEMIVSLLSDVLDRQTNRRAGVSGAKKARMLMKVNAGLPAGLEALGWRGVPNPAGNSAVVSGVNSIPLAQNTPALHPANRRAGVSGAKKARMLMKVNAGLPAWFGNVGVARRSQSGG